MGDNPDLTVEILKQIRDELRTSRDELRDELRATREELSGRIDATNSRLDATNSRLDRVVQEQIRQSTAIVELERGQHDIVAGLAKVVDAVVSLDHRQSVLERGHQQIVSELQKLNVRLDNVILGPLGTTVRDTSARVDDLELRVEALERRTG